MHSASRAHFCVVGGIMVGVAACSSGGSGGGAEPTSGDPRSEATTGESRVLGPAASDSHVDSADSVSRDEYPEPVAILSVGEGRTVEFFSLKGHSLIMESGPATGHPALPARLSPGHPADVFHALRPDLAVPDALVALQDAAAKNATERPPAISVWQDNVPTGASTPPALRVGGEKYKEASGKVTPDAVTTNNACNNNCCDQNWLNANICHPDFNGSWNYFDYGWSSESGSDGWDTDAALYAAACSGSGTSFFHFEYCDNGCAYIDRNVGQGNYQTWYIEDLGYFFGNSFNSDVNSSSSQHLHSHCGYWYTY